MEDTIVFLEVCLMESLDTQKHVSGTLLTEEEVTILLLGTHV